MTKPKWENEMMLEGLLEERVEILAKRRELNKRLKKVQLQIPKFVKRVDKHQAKKIRDYVRDKLTGKKVNSPIIIKA